jgi:hypothetical protein
LLEAGLAVADLGPISVIMTDLTNVVPLIRGNILLYDLVRSSSLSSDGISKTSLTTCDFAWGTALRQSNSYTEIGLKFSSCETILASDVVYYPEGYEPLIRTIVELLTMDNIDRKLILSHRHRHPQDGEFFAKLNRQNSLKVEEIDWKTEFGAENDLISLTDVKLFVVSRF